MIDKRTNKTMKNEAQKIQEAFDNEFQPIVLLKEYEDGGPNDQGWVIGYMRVTPEMFGTRPNFFDKEILTLIGNEKFADATEKKFGFRQKRDFHFVTEEQHAKYVARLEKELENAKL